MSLKLENVSYIYEQGTTQETAAIKNVNLEIKKGEFVAIIGHTGSGKSTLIQHFNGWKKQQREMYITTEKIFMIKILICKASGVV